MVMPGFSGKLVPTRIRLAFAAMIAFILLPVIGLSLPPLPQEMGTLVLRFGGEIMIGLYLGLIVQTLMAALNIAGMFISFQSGLSNAFSFDVVAEQQSTLLTTFLMTIGMTAIFVSNMHHLMIRAITDSYALFIPGQPLPLGDFSQVLSHTLSASFGFGIRLAAPLLVFGLIYYSGLGLLSRLSPQIQIFFIAMPLQIILALSLLMVSLPIIIFLFIQWFEASLIPFTQPR